MSKRGTQDQAYRKPDKKERTLKQRKQSKRLLKNSNWSTQNKKITGKEFSIILCLLSFSNWSKISVLSQKAEEQKKMLYAFHLSNFCDIQEVDIV